MDGMSQKPLDAGAFRAALDAVLRRRDPAALRAFLVEQGQWSPETVTDEEAAMWMMIAGSAALADLHGAAEAWLRSHGHAAEADAILRHGRPPGPRAQPRPHPTKRRERPGPPRAPRRSHGFDERARR